MRVTSDEAQLRILDAVRELLRERAFAELTVDRVMQEAGLARTVFYRHFDDLTQLMPQLLPTAALDVLQRIEEVPRSDPGAVVDTAVEELVELAAAEGRLLGAIVDASRVDPAVTERLEPVLARPRTVVAELLAAAPHPPEDPEESARLLIAAHRAYLLEAFGDGPVTPEARERVRAALCALWQRLLA